MRKVVGSELQESYLMPLLKALQRPLAIQVLDLRSSVTKEAMSLLVTLARTY